jgi:hypothetical protein
MSSVITEASRGRRAALPGDALPLAAADDPLDRGPRTRPRRGVRVLEAPIEALMERDLGDAKVMDPDLAFQHTAPRSALSLLREVRLQHLQAGREAGPSPQPAHALAATVLRALGVDSAG